VQDLRTEMRRRSASAGATEDVLSLWQIIGRFAPRQSATIQHPIRRHGPAGNRTRSAMKRAVRSWRVPSSSLCLMGFTIRSGDPPSLPELCLRRRLSPLVYDLTIIQAVRLFASDPEVTSRQLQHV
jgi:hypothetical protein